MRIITGDECGLLKETTCCIKPSNNTVTPKKPAHGDNSAAPAVSAGPAPVSVSSASFPYREAIVRRIPFQSSSVTEQEQEQKRSRGIIDFSPCSSNDCTPSTTTSTFRFGCVRLDQSVQLYEASKHELNNPKDGFEVRYETLSEGSVAASVQEDDVEYKPIGIHCLNVGGVERCIVADSGGQVSILQRKDASLDLLTRYNQHTPQPSSKSQPLAGNGGWCCTFLAREDAILLGGRDRETSLLDIHTGKVVWKAKNIPPNNQTLLEYPIFTTAASFSNHDTNALAVGTAYKQVRIYDVRTNTKSSQRRRPVDMTNINGPVMHHRITTLNYLSEYQLLVGDAGGYLHKLDTRYLAKGVLGRFMGPTGSVRSVHVPDEESKGRLCCVGLDRILRVYNVNKKKGLCKVYLKQRLNACLILPHSFSGEADDEEEEDDEPEEEEEEGIPEYNDDLQTHVVDDVEDYVDSSEESQDDSDTDSDSDSDGMGSDTECFAPSRSKKPKR